MVKCFGILETEKDNYIAREVSVLIELSDEHIKRIKEAVDFINENPSVTKISVDLCLSLPDPKITVIDTDGDSAEDFKDYTHIYARIFRNSMGIGMTYISSVDHINETEVVYFGYIKTKLFFKEAESKKLVVLGDYTINRLHNNKEFIKKIIKYLGKETFEQIIDISGLSLKDVLIKYLVSADGAI